MNNTAGENCQYRKLVTLATSVAVLVVVLMLLTKLVVWHYSPSASLLGSALDSLFDLVASVTNLLIVRWSLRPADNEHRFGHGKAENMAALLQGGIISVSAVLLIVHGWDRMLNPTAIEHTFWGIVVSVIAIILTLGLVNFQYYVIRQTDSLAIKADQLHYKSDLMLNFAVITALVLYQFDWQFADGLLAILIGLYLIWGALQLAYMSVQQLLDHQLPETELARIDQIIRRPEEVVGYHQLKTRRSGQHRFIQFHLELDQQLSLIEAHRISDQVQHALEAEFVDCQVIIHQDPVASGTSPIER
ncbi:cation diffusion facilitator family transporter [Thalassotalea litorea]|uniref:Cation-efflux pump FieF n=1 Tax=Thalassotalea litorea TaxID=2020715 RepID=A0A5R9IJR9_9GAMM|nr:cation diffusion facilitator family transporter [Thalassotalea litorea]TLU65794.1 cation diffusion facilitator family transporter [Thalassotalea litorea]